MAPLDASGLKDRLASADYRGCRVTLVGYGNMGLQYYKALRALGVASIRVCALPSPALEALAGTPGVEIVAGGVAALEATPTPDELAIVAVPIEGLVDATDRLVHLGYRRVLIEKPVSLESGPIAALAARLDAAGVMARCAYNRALYPAVQEVRARAAAEGGVTSCTYAFTEMIKPDWPQRFPAAELARWGVANSLHVMSLAHAIIGGPATWQASRAGQAVAWHPSGSVFVGHGVSHRGVLFSYHADWGSTGRWVVEVHTRVASYRFCPLEQVERRATALGPWERLEIPVFATDVKAGIVEEVAAMLPPTEDLAADLPTLADTAALTAFGEDVFGY